MFVAINISYNVAETNNSKDKFKYKFWPKHHKPGIFLPVWNLTQIDFLV